MKENAYIAINYNCNYNCMFCPHMNNPARRKGEMSFDEFKHTFDFILKSRPQTNHVTISGGEPTLNKDFIKIMNYIYSKNVDMVLFSNSDRFSNPDLVQELSENVDLKKLLIVSVIHSHKEAVHERITQVPGSFGRTVKGIKNLINAGADVRIKNCINKLNYKDLIDYLSFVCQEFPKANGLELCGLDYCGITSEQSKVVEVGFSEMGASLNKLFEFIERNQIDYRVLVRDLPLCIVKKEYFRYLIRNEVQRNGIYSSADLGNSLENKVIFNSPIQCGPFSEKCRDCEFSTRCYGAWKTAWQLLGDNEITPIKPRFFNLESDHIFLKFLQEQDVSIIYNWDCDLTTRHFWHDYAELEPLFSYKENVLKNWQKKYHQIFMIFEKKSNLPVGFIYSSKYDKENGHLDISIYVDQKFRKSYVAAEAGILFCDHLFKNYPLRKIYLTSYSNNSNSLAFSKSAGFTEEGRFKKHRYFNGSYHDKIILSLFKEDFYQKIMKIFPLQIRE